MDSSPGSPIGGVVGWIQRIEPVGNGGVLTHTHGYLGQAEALNQFVGKIEIGTAAGRAPVVDDRRLAAQGHFAQTSRPRNGGINMAFPKSFSTRAATWRPIRVWELAMVRKMPSKPREWSASGPGNGPFLGFVPVGAVPEGVHEFQKTVHGIPAKFFGLKRYEITVRGQQGSLGGGAQPGRTVG